VPLQRADELDVLVGDQRCEPAYGEIGGDADAEVGAVDMAPVRDGSPVGQIAAAQFVGEVRPVEQVDAAADGIGSSMRRVAIGASFAACRSLSDIHCVGTGRTTRIGEAA
jgi:hypothetical protein